jgi:glucose/arabinose dehydrogenase
MLGLPGSGQARTETFRWLDSNPDPSPVAAFRLHLGESSRNYTLVLDAGMPPADASDVRSFSTVVPDDAVLYVSMTALDAEGLESVFSNELVRLPDVGGPTGLPPDGSIDEPTGPVTITAGESVVFAGSGAGGAPPLSYGWIIDDGSSAVLTSMAQNPGPIEFSQPGTHTVSLELMDSEGQVDATPATVTVTVNAPQPPPGGSSGNDAFAPAPFDVVVPRVATGLDTPVYLTAPRGDPRLFVLELGGGVRIVEDGGLLPLPFLDLSFDVSDAEEGGLLGLAFDPDYTENGFFYIYRTDRLGDSVLSRFQVGADPYVVDADSEEVLLRVAQPFDGQNGGTIAFGPDDGFLYLGLGDGGSSNDPGDRAQDGGVLLGKLLRLDVGVPPAPDSIPGSGGYAIPADNPFVGDPHVRDEIWAFGLRNPYRFSFDRDLFDLWLTDEGQDAREEINFEARGDAGGRNYGWDVMEGSLCNENDPAPAPPCDDPSIELPLHDYPHTHGNCAITGGYVYRGTMVEQSGQYFFGDYCSGRIWSFDPTTGEGLDWTEALGDAAGVPFQLASFGEGGAGDLYVVHVDGDIFRIGLPNPECSDGFDNDGDTFIDFPEDPGCPDAEASFEDPVCDDGFDNDGDGFIDFPEDPGCPDAAAPREDPACNDGIDNDGQSDLLDSDCPVASRNSEEESSNYTCGLGAELVFVLPPLIWMRRRLRPARGGRQTRARE